MDVEPWSPQTPPALNSPIYLSLRLAERNAAPPHDLTDAELEERVQRRAQREERLNEVQQRLRAP